MNTGAIGMRPIAPPRFWEIGRPASNEADLHSFSSGAQQSHGDIDLTRGHVAKYRKATINFHRAALD
jgi:hypothetical protein